MDRGPDLEEAERAGTRLVEGANRPATAQAFYRQGELHRLRGDLPAAENAYRAARQHGLEPQPGFALLRLAQGEKDAAAAAIRRRLAETTDRPTRGRLLPASVEIMIAAGELDAARAACLELDEIAAHYSSAMLTATAAHAWGAVRLATGDATNALVALRHAAQGWQELEAPFESARTRVLLALACQEIGDAETGALELEAARETLAELGAATEVARVEALLGHSRARDSHGLTARELDVLRLVAAGKTNRDLAAALVISEHTVSRHLQNIFRKLDVSSRTAASAFAHEHDLL
jgi:DNA-binding NarL/FixJ family response regulator